jgi:hypothetical protein
MRNQTHGLSERKVLLKRINRGKKVKLKKRKI